MAEKRLRLKRIQEAPLRLSVLAVLVLSDLAIKYNVIKGRGILPEPFDYFNNVGNASVSVIAGGTVAAAAARSLRLTESITPENTRAIALIAGSVAVTALNIISETKYSLSFNSSTPDTMDLLYGVAAGTLAASRIDVSESLYDDAIDATESEPRIQGAINNLP